MAIYHCSASVIGRAKGRSICAAAAYRAGEAITDERTGLAHDFTRKGGVLYSEIIVPSGSPDWASNRARLWNEAERAEDKSTRRATATTGREFRLALPHELDERARVSCGRDFSRYMADSYGVAVDFSIHAPNRDGDSRNYHLHVLISDRRLTDAGFAGKVRELSARNGGEKTIVAIREQWAIIANRHLAAAGLNLSIDHRSYKARWIDRDATAHMGPAASAMERRGEATDVGDFNRAVAAGNEARDALKAELEAVGLALVAEERARLEWIEERAESAAVNTQDPAAILDAITAKRSTFTKGELAATLRKTVHSDDARARLMTAIFAHPDLVALSEQPGGKATRYTTEAVLQHEAAGLAAARALMADASHGLSRATVRRIVESGRYGTMTPEQHAAFIGATSAEGLAIIAGEAGTGKSYVARAIREGYEAEGRHVVGLAVTNKVIQDMARDGFTHTRTIHGALQDLARGRASWNEKTVLIVDEAAMLSTKQTVDIMTAAARAGAKVISIQDTRQLGSAFARGGLAGAIEAEHPAAVSRLSEIRRIKDTATDADGQRRAFNLMHEGQWSEALTIFDKGGAIHWSATNDDARAALARQYAEDVNARPDCRRFALAQSNADVLRLNADLRAIHRARGDLGADHVLQTTDGPQPFAVGDRVQFTASAYKRADRDAGIANGNHGTIRQIDGARVQIELDGAKGQPPRVVSFTVGENAREGEFNGFRHGYAGTVYRSQGSTIDEVYRLHTGAERAATNYVGNTRHTEKLRIYTSRDAVRGADPWMRERGGLDALSEAKRESAARSYAKWTEDSPELGQRYGLADYVAYVQDRWTEDQSRAADLEALARQMSRHEENRAASQFHRTERQAPPSAERPTTKGQTMDATAQPPQNDQTPAQLPAEEARRIIAEDARTRRAGRTARLADLKRENDEQKEKAAMDTQSDHKKYLTPAMLEADQWSVLDYEIAPDASSDFLSMARSTARAVRQDALYELSNCDPTDPEDCGWAEEQQYVIERAEKVIAGIKARAKDQQKPPQQRDEIGLNADYSRGIVLESDHTPEDKARLLALVDQKELIARHEAGQIKADDKPRTAQPSQPTAEEQTFKIRDRDADAATFWRADTGYKHGRGESAADIVKHEQEELGNRLGVSPAQLAALSKVPASAAFWVTASKDAAARYGRPEKINLGEAPLCIAKDGEGGLLMIDSRAVSAELRGAFDQQTEKDLFGKDTPTAPPHPPAPPVAAPEPRDSNTADLFQPSRPENPAYLPPDPYIPAKQVQEARRASLWETAKGWFIGKRQDAQPPALDEEGRRKDAVVRLQSKPILTTGPQGDTLETTTAEAPLAAKDEPTPTRPEPRRAAPQTPAPGLGTAATTKASQQTAQGQQPTAAQKADQKGREDDQKRMDAQQKENAAAAGVSPTSATSSTLKTGISAIRAEAQAKAAELKAEREKDAADKGPRSPSPRGRGMGR